MALGKVHAVVAVGVALRLAAFAANLDKSLQNRLEFITPLNSMQRLQEGLFLHKIGLGAFSGDTFHQPPLVLLPFLALQKLEELVSLRTATVLLITALDAVIAWGFYVFCKAFMASQAEKQSEKSKIWLNHPPVSPLLTPETLPVTTAAMYLFNPYSFVSTLTMSTSIFNYAAIVWSFAHAMQGDIVVAVYLLSIAVYLTVYPIVLIVPLLLMIHQVRQAPSSSSRLPFARTAFAFILLAGSVSILLYLSFLFVGNWSFIDSTYLWIVQYPDLTPNIGVFWYFFMEMFDRFRNYFLFLLHIHPFLYVIPLYIRLHSRPLPYACVLLALFAVFQAYPCFGDVGFVLSCAIMHPASILGMSNKFILTTGLVVATVLLPVMGFLWLYPGSGNANFFYNQTIVFQFFFLRLIAQFLYATMRRDKQIDEHFKLSN